MAKLIVFGRSQNDWQKNEKNRGNHVTVMGKSSIIRIDRGRELQNKGLMNGKVLFELQQMLVHNPSNKSVKHHVYSAKKQSSQR